MTDLPLRDAYDRQAATYGSKRNPLYDAFRDSVLDWFAAEVTPVSRSIVDLGSGPGYESLYLQQKGLSPLAVDFSEGMIAECRAKGLTAEQQNFTQLSLLPAAFGGALMSFSLLHLPKAKAPQVISDVATLLKPGGTLLILLFEGDGEGPRRADERLFGTARWFSYYTANELRQLLPDTLTAKREWHLDISPRATLGLAATHQPY